MTSTVALLIILAILAFFVALFTIRVRVNLEMQDEIKLSVIAFGVKINVLPKKPKRYNLNNYTPEKIAKRNKKAKERAQKKAEADKLKKAAKEAKKKQKKEEEARLTKADKKAIKAKKRASIPPIPDLLSLLTKILKLFFSGLFSKFHFHVARIHIEVGSDNASSTALLCVAVRTALKPILIFLDKHSNLHGMKNAHVLVVPNFLSEEIKTDIKLGFSMSLGGLLGTVFKAAFAALFGFLKIKPTVPAEIEEKARQAELKKRPPQSEEDGSKAKKSDKNRN